MLVLFALDSPMAAEAGWKSRCRFVPVAVQPFRQRHTCRMFSIGDSIDYYRRESVWGCRGGISCLERRVGHGPGSGALVLSIHSRIRSVVARCISRRGPPSRIGFSHHDIALGPRRVCRLPPHVLRGSALVSPPDRGGLSHCVHLFLDSGRRFDRFKRHSPFGVLAGGCSEPIWNRLI